jgi:ligand-binding sensor domain-containing protein
LTDDNINAIAIDRSGNKWLGTWGGLTKFDGVNWTVFTTSNSELYDDNVNAIAIDRSGNKWVGTSGGLAKFDGANWTVFTTENSGLPDDIVNTILIDSTGDIWVGTWGGLAKFDGTNWTVFDSVSSGLPDNGVLALAVDSSRSTWIGTYNGLAKFDGTNWAVFTISTSGLPTSDIRSIVIDGYGNKWIGTYGGGLAVLSSASAAKTNRKSVLNPILPVCRNYPDPFRQKTTIRYTVPKGGPVCLRIYSLDGQLVQTLVNMEQTTGEYTASWNGKNENGTTKPRGVYVCQLKTNGYTTSRQMNFVE